MDEIKIQVKSQFQKMLLEVLWKMDTLEQCLAFRDSLPNQQQRNICDTMILLLAIEYIDQQITTEADCAEARAIIHAVAHS